MRTLAGTTNLDGSLEVSRTVTPPYGTPRLTVPELKSVPEDSEALAGKVTDRGPVSLS
jgi:hypothetical protein